MSSFLACPARNTYDEAIYKLTLKVDANLFPPLIRRKKSPIATTHRAPLGIQGDHDAAATVCILSDGQKKLDGEWSYCRRRFADVAYTRCDRGGLVKLVRVVYLTCDRLARDKIGRAVIKKLGLGRRAVRPAGILAGHDKQYYEFRRYSDTDYDIFRVDRAAFQKALAELGATGIDQAHAGIQFH